jgi:hypothetical protein
MSASQCREFNNKLDREGGIKPPMSPRALEEREQMFTAWFDANPGYGVFENQDRVKVQELIFEYLDSEEIPWSVSAVANAAEYLRRKGVLHRESDVHSGKTGEFVHGGARMVVHPTRKNPILNPPPQNVEIVERRKRITVQDLRKMSAEEYAEALRNPTLAPQIEALLAQS